jgi:hypothetical protein
MDGKETIAQTALPCPDANTDDAESTPTHANAKVDGKDIFATSQYASKYTCLHYNFKKKIQIKFK